MLEQGQKPSGPGKIMLESSAKITNFHYAFRSHLRATTDKHLRFSKEGKQDTKEDKGKSLMHAL